MLAKNWQFLPDVIAVERDERVRLIIQGQDGTRGFAIPDLRIHEKVASGASVIIDLPTDMAGTFRFICSTPCAEEGGSMTGTLIIR